MIVLGLDVALNTTGWGLIKTEDGDPVICGRGHIGGPALIHTMQYFLQQHRADLVVIERPWLARGDKGDVEMTAKLNMEVGRWLALCQLEGMKTQRVHAQTWQMAILGGRNGLINGRAKRAMRKIAAIYWAEQTFPNFVFTEDEAEATAMAVWGLRTSRAAKNGQLALPQDSS